MSENYDTLIIVDLNYHISLSIISKNKLPSIRVVGRSQKNYLRLVPSYSFNNGRHIQSKPWQSRNYAIHKTKGDINLSEKGHDMLIKGNKHYNYDSSQLKIRIESILWQLQNQMKLT
jgi:hypothetical protein